MTVGNTRGIVYSVNDSGHRKSYVDLISKYFGLDPLVAPMSATVRRRMISAEKLLFVTLDDDIFGFARVALARTLRARPTAALFLRAQKCFESGRWYYAPKRYAFSLMRRLPNVTLATITPFAVAPRYVEVAHAGVCDPQYWDLVRDHHLPQPQQSALAAEARSRAGGRGIVSALGTLSEGKGMAFLADMLEKEPRLARETLFICAGRVPVEARAVVARLEAAGALVVNRFASDAEIESLYGCARAVWVCYAPSYDQASGIFGRAMQYAVTPIVREGSLVDSFAAHYGISTISLTYGARQAGAELANALALLPVDPAAARNGTEADRRARLIAGWQVVFIATIEAALEGRRVIAD